MKVVFAEDILPALTLQTSLGPQEMWQDGATNPALHSFLKADEPWVAVSDQS